MRGVLLIARAVFLAHMGYPPAVEPYYFIRIAIVVFLHVAAKLVKLLVLAAQIRYQPELRRKMCRLVLLGLGGF